MVKVAVVDDHTLFRKSLVKMLATFPSCRPVFDCSHGQELLDYLTWHSVDLVLLDVQMPVMDGFATCKALQENYPAIKTIVISQYTDRDSVHQMMDFGAHGFFSKSADPTELEMAIRSVDQKGYYFGVDLGLVIREALLWDSKINKNQVYLALLTPREIEIIKLACQGYASKEIAHVLKRSVRTIETNRNKIMEKTNTRNFIGAVVVALKTKQITFDEIESRL